MTKKNPAGSPKLKTGTISKAERKYIDENYGQVSVEDMAKHLGRTPVAIYKAIAQRPTIAKQAEQGDWVSRLLATSFWLEIKKSLIDHEIGFFQKRWAALCTQFSSSGDVLETDEMMIKDLIIADIFSMRSSTDKADVIRLISQLEDEIKQEEQASEEVQDKDKIENCRNQIISLQTAKGALAKQYLDYQKEKKSQTHDLKGSRDQRFKQQIESNRSFFELFKELDTLKKRKEEGRISKKVFEAAQVVKNDWNQIMEYEDGTLDKPFLSPEGELEDARIQNEQEQKDRQHIT